MPTIVYEISDLIKFFLVAANDKKPLTVIDYT